MSGPGAAIDIGSNTVRMLIADKAPPGTRIPWRRMDYAQRITRLGAGLHASGALSDTGIERTLAALDECSRLLRRHALAPEDAHAVATAAVREASNGKDFIRRCTSLTGIRPHIIDGATEARLSLDGSSAVLLPETRRHMLLFDIGGGSTEFIRARNGTVLDCLSRKLGVVRLTEAHLSTDPPAWSDYAAMMETVNAHLHAVEGHWGSSTPPPALVGTAGTITTLAALHLNLFPYDADIINNHVITWSDLLGLRDQLLRMTCAERARLPALERGREDLIIAGLAITEAVMRRWGYRELVCVDAGLLEGVWLAGNTTYPLHSK